MSFKEKTLMIYEKIKFFFLDLKKFIWYIMTEPFRYLASGLDNAKKHADVLQRIQVWAVIFALLSAITLSVGRKMASLAFAVCFVLVIIEHEWKRGFFRKRWKDKEFKRLEKKMKEQQEQEKTYGVNEKDERDRDFEIHKRGESLDRINNSNDRNNSIPSNKEIQNKKEDKPKEKPTRTGQDEF